MRASGRELPVEQDDRYGACLDGQGHYIVQLNFALDIWMNKEDYQGRALFINILTEEKAFPDLE